MRTRRRPATRASAPRYLEGLTSALRRPFALASKMVPTDLCNQLTDTCTWRIA
jgi:hypothetical protein